MKFLLTGGSGLIGSYVVKFLLEAGQQVNVLVRNPSKLYSRNQFNLKVFEGNIIDYKSVDESIKDCDIVIHLAALVRATTQNPSEFFSTNVNGTLNLLKAAEKNKIKKFIFISSLAGHEFLQQTIINENSLTEPKQYFSKYAESKAKAEELVLEYSKYGLPYIIIYPTRVFGIGPLTDANGATKAINLYLKNRLPFLIDRGEQYSSWAFVEDVARGIIMGANSDVSNQRYILGGENKTLADVYRIADKISGKKHLKIYLKNKTALSLASVLEFQAKLMRRKPIITREWLNFVLDSYKISSEKAIAELNYKITPIETALEKTINWLKTL
ncbi:MAG: NAD-dependent epimerase/dehydratase family protein [Ignavibacteria bacterium]|nr:MAG: NAD-dependent epimerase/dehydratase family protein [Ignavibacteria bacterium]